MIANHRYLQASLFSFCIHAALFLYIYGTFDSNTSQKLLISQPLQIELRFDLPSPDIKKQTPTAPKAIAAPVEKTSQNIVYSKATDVIQTKQNNALIESSIANLLSEESEIEADRENQEISMYAQKIITTIENAWMKPKNIPKDLVANLRLKIHSSGRIAGAELIKSSGNIRFDNSALQAVRRVETFSFLIQFQKIYMIGSFK